MTEEKQYSERDIELAILLEREGCASILDRAIKKHKYLPEELLKLIKTLAMLIRLRDGGNGVCPLCEGKDPKCDLCEGTGTVQVDKEWLQDD